MTTRQRYLAMLRTFDDPALKTVCAPVRDGDDLSFLKDMRKVCGFTDNGVGLAAPQIGVLKQAAFIWPRRAGFGIFLINPRGVDASHEMQSGEEGCLSYPGVTAEVVRHRWIDVDYLDDAMKPRTRRFTDFDAVVVQHECDHLDGICRVGDAWRRKMKLEVA
jgi:peptide deformylase